MSALLAAVLEPLGQIFATRRLRRSSPQQRFAVLRALLVSARNTRFGREHDFAGILAAKDLYAAFHQAVPPSDYDSWVRWLGEAGPLGSAGTQPLLDQGWPGKIDIFCLSSGTTSGRTKYIPYSREMARINRVAALDFFAHMLHASPELVPPLSRSLYMSGSTRLARDSAGVVCGDMSALTRWLAPRFLDRITLPPPEVAALEPWSNRLEALVEVALKHPEIGTIFGIPIWILTFLERLTARANRPLDQILPRLRFLSHGGMSIAPYASKLRALIGPGVELLEVYAASEIGLAAFQLPGEKGMRFFESYEVFYEFESDDGQIQTADRLIPGQSYSLLATSCAGLWRYKLGDRLIFSQTQPLILDSVSRDKTTSAFDEKLTERELELAMAGATPSFPDFSLGPDIVGRRHVWFLIGERQPGEAWLEALDAAVRAHNQDYDDYRSDGRIHSPLALAIPDRAVYLERIGRREGGQRKFPRLLSADEVALLLKAYGG